MATQVEIANAHQHMVEQFEIYLAENANHPSPKTLLMLLYNVVVYIVHMHIFLLTQHYNFLQKI